MKKILWIIIGLAAIVMLSGCSGLSGLRCEWETEDEVIQRIVYEGAEDDGISQKDE